VSGRKLLVIGSAVAFVGFFIIAFAYIGSLTPTTYPDCGTTGVCPSVSEPNWLGFYAYGLLWCAAGLGILFGSEVFQPARRVTPLEGRLLLERFEGPLQKDD
jgi:hypothetical protein